MGLQQVKDEILEEAREKASEIEAEAEEKEQEILENARKESERIRNWVEEETQEEKTSLEKKELSKAKMASKKKVQEAKQSQIENAFQEFREELEGLSEQDLNAYVETGIEMANFDVKSVKASAQFREIIDRDFEEIKEEGIILESESGEKSLNLTFDRVLEQMKNQYKTRVAQILFGEA